LTLVVDVAAALRSRTQLPEIDQRLDLDTAYELQHQVAALVAPDGAAGIKAGVTAPALQQNFGLDHALLGTLYAGSILNSEAVLQQVDGLMLECELAVLAGADGALLAVAPAIEVVGVRFARREDATAANLILCNLGADRCIVGEWQAWPTSSEQINVSLSHDGAVVNHASVTAAFGQPQHAAAWIWQEKTRRGFSTGNETLLMTGACGKVVPAQAGEYVADFGALGTLTFSVVQDSDG
jgi:2-keto-4-pentenoate hydratase